MVKFRPFILLSFIIVFVTTFLLACQAQASASIQVQLDRDVVEQGESFTIQFNATGDVDGDPDFSPLQKNFDIEQQSQSSNIQIINGHMSSNKKWTLVLMPKASGKLVIPSISFGADKTAPGFITVKKTTSSSNSTAHGLLYMEVEATPKQPYVQSQVLFTVRIYHAISLVNASLSDITLSDKNAMQTKLGKAITYTKYVNNRRYKVIEKRFAIFPQSSGSLTIDSVQFQGQFVNDMGMLSSRVINSKPVTLTVRPEVASQASTPGGNWLPAKNVTVMDSWAHNKPQFQVGEPVTRTITMVADGLMGEQLPPLKFPSIANLKQYPDQPQITNNKDNNGVSGARQEKIAFIPTRSGTYHLPAINIAWWDTVHDKAQIAKIAAMDITVAPAVGQSQGQSTPLPTNNANNNTAPAQSSGSEVAGGKPTTAPVTQANSSAHQSSPVWFWISLGLFVLWFATLVIWWWQRRQVVSVSTPGDTNPQKQRLGQIEKELKAICNRHDARQAKDKLIQWAQVNWREQAPTSLGEIGKHCDPELARELASLNQVLYSHVTGQWDGPSFWRVFTAHKPAINQKQRETELSLQPLFRHTA